VNPTWLFVLALFVSFEAFALWIAGRRGPSDSRRALAVTLVLMLPGLGLLLAVVVRRIRGRGAGGEPPSIEVPQPELTREEVLHMADQQCALDRLMSVSPEARLDALVGLACANDANAITLLRWAVQHGPREAMLEAALTLEELDVQRARQLDEAARAFEEHPSFATAVAAGDAALVGILNGLADRAMLPTLAERARAWFRYAELTDPARRGELTQRLSVLEGDCPCSSVGLRVIVE
jgi:hypothetical protein